MQKSLAKPDGQGTRELQEEREQVNTKTFLVTRTEPSSSAVFKTDNHWLCTKRQWSL